MYALTHMQAIDAMIWLREFPVDTKKWGYYIPDGGVNRMPGASYGHFEVFSSRVVSR